MPSYRLYRLDGAGKISAAEWIEAENDQQALLSAGERVDGARYELWDRNRLVSPPQKPS